MELAILFGILCFIALITSIKMQTKSKFHFSNYALAIALIFFIITSFILINDVDESTSSNTNAKNNVVNPINHK